MKHEIFSEHLKSTYFTCVTQLPSYSFYGYLKYVAVQIHNTVPAKYTGIYQMNQWSNKFELITENYCADHKDCIAEITIEIKNSIIQQNKQQNSVTIDGYKILTIPIYNDFQLNYYLVIITRREALSSNEINILQKETQIFFTTIHTFLDIQNDKEKSELLRELSSSIFTTANISVILRRVISELESFYPTFKYHILLSQDHEVDEDLRVTLIDYSDETTQRTSTKAFMTGEIQIEKLVAEESTCLYVPLRGMQGVYGVLQIIVPQMLQIPDKELDFFCNLARTTGQAVENALLYQSSDDLVTDLKLVNKVSHKLNSNLEISDIISLVKNQVQTIFSPDEIGFVHFQHDNPTVDNYNIASESSDLFRKSKGRKFIKFIAEKMIKNHESIFSGNYTNVYPSLDYSSIASIPMTHGSVLQGFIIVLGHKKSAFSFQNFKLVESIIQHSSLAQLNAILKEQLEEAVITDYLTKLFSRNYLDEMINMHMEMDELGVLILFDIDDFKNINDQYGHYVGDQVIIQVANILLGCEIEDVIQARWGGEELALYLPHYHQKDALVVAENVRKLVKDTTSPNVTLSSGVAMWEKGESLSVTDLFIRADQALYVAKRNGKNQVVVDAV